MDTSPRNYLPSDKTLPIIAPLSDDNLLLVVRARMKEISDELKKIIADLNSRRSESGAG